MEETIAEIRRQGGLVYVPHPFDRLHSVPDYEHLLRDRRGDRHPRGLQPAGRADRVQRGGRAVRRQVPDRAGRRIRQPRRPGTRQRDDPRARLRGPGGVPRGDARRRHRPQAQEPDLRPGAEAAADDGPPSGVERPQRAARPVKGAGRGRVARRRGGRAAAREASADARGRSGAGPSKKRRPTTGAATREPACPPPTTRSRRSTSSARSAS